MSKACECGCGMLAKKRFVKGHQWRKRSEVSVIGSTGDFGSPSIGSTPTLGTNDPQPPPPHPLPYDHGKWRVCEEAIGTDLNQPWQLSYCLECRLPTFTHNARSVERHEVVCESCYYQLMNELADNRVAKENRTRTPHDPFQ